MTLTETLRQIVRRHLYMPASHCVLSITGSFISSPVDIIWSTMIVGGIRGKIIRTVLCCVVYDSCAQWYAHTYEQFLKLTVGLGLGWVFVRLFRFSILCVFLVYLRIFCLVSFCCVRFSFFGTAPRDWLGRKSPKWPVLCRVGRKTLTQSINESGCACSGCDLLSSFDLT